MRSASEEPLPPLAEDIPLVPLFWSIGRASKYLGVKSFVIRHWESQLRMPVKRTSGGHRAYSRRQMAILVKVRNLVHSNGFALGSAIKLLRADPESGLPAPPASPVPLRFTAEERSKFTGMLAGFAIIRAWMNEAEEILRGLVPNDKAAVDDTGAVAEKKKT